MIYNLCVTLINRYKKNGQLDKLEEMKDKIDVYFAANRITEAQYNELMAMIG